MTDADDTAVDGNDPDGWAPLPEAKRILHPGELMEPASHPHAPGEPLPLIVTAQQGIVEEPDHVAEQAMRELSAHVAHTEPSTSLVSQVMHREENKERQQRAANAVRAADAAVAERKQPRDPLPIEYEAGAHGRDTREEEKWFKSLPAAEQERLHAAWAQKRRQALANIDRRSRYRNRRLVAALLVFAAVVLTGTGIKLAATAGAGICCGIWWRFAAPDRYRDPLRALACFFGAHTIAAVAHGGSLSPSLFLDAVLIVGFSTIVGFDGEMRRSGGLDSK